jgi:hypothetical protein
METPEKNSANEKVSTAERQLIIENLALNNRFSGVFYRFEPILSLSMKNVTIRNS